MPNIIIAGCGFAGGVMALRCLQLGFDVTMLDVPRPDIGGVEIIPSSARHLLSELRLDAALTAVRPALSMGMLRCLGDGAPEFREGRSLHVDRLALRRAIIAEAASRGAEIRRLRQLPPPDDDVFASIDATGRRAAWSRPVTRYGRTLADVFSAPRLTGYDTSLVVGLGPAWAYAASDQAGTTIGIIHGGGMRRPELEHAVRATLGLGRDAPLTYLGRRSAFSQSAVAPLQGRVISIGDAAFSHDPIGGRGLSFALGSVFAAGAVLQTWRDHPARSQSASAYYQDYVVAEKDCHLAFLSEDQERAGQLPSAPSHVLWSAREALAPLALAEGIDIAEVVLTQAGTRVRWLGRFDIFEMRALCDRVQRTNALIEGLCRKGLTITEARAMLEWALRHGILRAADPGHSG
jgi:2-polyprenyl-6-methoxyphenol hydroxylase-like FAD-dependent oxidoreductase